MSALTCSRCGLTLAPRTAWMGIEHCPRCVARARVLVPLRVVLPSPRVEPELPGPDVAPA